MITYQREGLKEVLDSGRLALLLLEHWREIAHFKDIQLDVNWGAYHAVETAGKLRIYTARRVTELVGYVAYFVNVNPHYQGSLQAVQDVLFLAPEHRKALAGYRLLLYSERQLAEEGVQAVYQHSKIAHQLDAFFTRLGYEAVDTLWAKRLDRS